MSSNHTNLSVENVMWNGISVMMTDSFVTLCEKWLFFERKWLLQCHDNQYKCNINVLLYNSFLIHSILIFIILLFYWLKYKLYLFKCGILYSNDIHGNFCLCWMSSWRRSGSGCQRGAGHRQLMKAGAGNYQLAAHYLAGYILGGVAATGNGVAWWQPAVALAASFFQPSG